MIWVFQRLFCSSKPPSVFSLFLCTGSRGEGVLGPIGSACTPGAAESDCKSACAGASTLPIGLIFQISSKELSGFQQQVFQNWPQAQHREEGQRAEDENYARQQASK